jgi:hypothetical protein
MAAKRKPRAREAHLAFEALSIEGGLLSPESLSKIAQVQAGTQTETDYRIHKGLNLRDEIGRYWRIAQAHWADFKSGRGARADPKAVSERFVLALLRDAFGFTSLAAVPPITLSERSYPIGYAALGGRAPVVIGPADCGLDVLLPSFGDGNRKRSAFGLAQEYLNAEDSGLWGVVSDGVALRIVRDNASLTRPAWIEADLQRIFTEERYADFAALWLLCHETRFGREGQPVTDCALEAWREAGREEGTRAREHLRRGVEDALAALGQGFLSHAENQTLRADLQSGALAVKDYFNQLLRLVYRLIFLLTVEERGLLYADGTSEDSKALYAGGYGIRRLRERSVKRSAHDRFSDLWDATKIVSRGLANGEPRLGLPALVGIFSGDQCPALDAAKIENSSLLLAVFKLAWLREDGNLSRVNWRDMGPEELGSVYESLLELVPQITKDGRRFAFATGGETKGNARKTTGSYYTPDSLVQVLVDSAVEPVIAAAIADNPGHELEALLNLSIVDPACGSGHFLLAAARRLASHVARLEANGTPSAGEYRHALRRVVGRCIYGVDLNPMAVELCKVGLWMEAVEPGLPLTFLNSHIQHGNALLGTTPDLMAKGIPDNAWDAIEGDDKKIASALKKRNKAEAGGQRTLNFGVTGQEDAEALKVARAVATLEEQSDANPEALAKKESQWDGILGSAEYRHQKFIADAWCATFVWPKETGGLADAAPTNDLWRRIREEPGQPSAATTRIVNELAERYRFFHWHLQFPQVFSKGGFDVVLGNPPWERVKLQEQEFFASRSEEITKATNSAARKKLISKLPEVDPPLWTEWCAASRRAEGESHFVRNSLRYPLCGKGDVNTYAIFAEHNSKILRKRGRAGFIVPTGLVTDENTSEYLRTLVGCRRLVSALDFENTATAAFFPGVGHGRFKFCLVTVVGDSLPAGHQPEFIFYADEIRHLQDQWRRFTLSDADFALFNPTTRTCPVFRTRRDADLARRVYEQTTILKAGSDIDLWEVRFIRMLDMSNDSHLFKTREAIDLSTNRSAIANAFWDGTDRLLPLFEAKMIHLFDHRYGDYRDQPENSENTSLPDVPLIRLQDQSYELFPRYWVPQVVADESITRSGWSRDWFFAWRDIARAGDERTTILTVLPRVACGHTLPVLLIGTKTGEPAAYADCMQAMMSSLMFDYIARLKNGGTHMTFGLVEQLPVFPPSRFLESLPWLGGEQLIQFIRPRVLELTFTSDSVTPYARHIGYEGSPFRWDPDRRVALKAELDALFFHLVGFERDAVEYVLGTFKRLGLNEVSKYGEYRTKRVILEIYDAMSEANRTGRAYRTRLNPPPADPSIAHPMRVAALPTMPSVIPQIPAAEEAAIVIWALLHAAEGTLTRTDLARAYALRGRPDLLRRFAPSPLSQASEWATKVGARSVAQGLLAVTLKTLSDRNGIVLGINAELQSTVSTSPTTPEEELIDPWFRFEARLALHVLHALPADAFEVVDNAFSGDDRALLERAS